MKKKIKCIVWDLDNTLWHGILLEDSNVKLKKGIIEIIKKIDYNGVLHSIASKNNYDDVMKKLDEFQIAEYFLYPEINWNDKSISNIQKNINIAMDSILFIDDQQYERDEVKFAHPEVTCIDASYYSFLCENLELNHKKITQDSQRRRLMYIEDMKRRKHEEHFNGSSEKFLESLNMKFIISKARKEDLERVM